jgi:hypothetical protein
LEFIVDVGDRKKYMIGSETFIAARPSAWTHALSGAALPLVMHALGITSVEYRLDDLERLRSVAGERVLSTPNHPTNMEPALLFHLACTLRQRFYYLACRESFDNLWGLWGGLIRRLGAFSVERGTADRASFRATREVMTQPASHLVIFPEGEIYSQNDTLLPFHSGAIQLAFWALDDIRKTEGTDRPFFVAPIAIKYRFVDEMGPAIESSLKRLEAFTGVPAGTDSAPYSRLRRIGEAMLCSLEREYMLPGTTAQVDDSGALTPRLDAIKEAILHRVAAAAGVALPRGDTLPERMRALTHVIETVSQDELSAATPYDTELRRHQRVRARPLLRDLERLANWIAVYDGYVAADPSPERMADTLTRLERECWGKTRLKGHRTCRVRLGELLNLQDCYQAYEKDRRGEVSRVTREVERRVAAALTAI